MSRYSDITFMSDYGASSESIGVCKSVMRTICRDAHVIDLTHEIPPFDVRAGSLALVRAAHYLNPGIVLAVVDPGTGTSRRAIAVEVGGGESILVGPDNGLLAPVTALVGGADRVFEISNYKYMLASPNGARSGRDLFAPVAAHLCAGIDISELGDEVDPNALVPGLVPFSGEKQGVLHADVIYVDNFGNVELNATADQIADYGDVVVVTKGSQSADARRVSTYEDLGNSELGIRVDANGMVALVCKRASASQRHSLRVGDGIQLKPIDTTA